MIIFYLNLYESVYFLQVKVCVSVRVKLKHLNPNYSSLTVQSILWKEHACSSLETTKTSTSQMTTSQRYWQCVPELFGKKFSFTCFGVTAFKWSSLSVQNYHECDKFTNLIFVSPTTKYYHYSFLAPLSLIPTSKTISWAGLTACRLNLIPLIKVSNLVKSSEDHDHFFTKIGVLLNASV